MSAAPVFRRNARAIGLMFLLIASVRVAMVFAFAPALPYFDEWDGVIAGIALPLRHSQFDPAFLFAAHNGHPLLWTKLISLSFLRANGGSFDNIPVCVLSQLLYALAGATLASTIACRLGPERGWFLLAAMVVMVVPFDWENITMGWNNSHLVLAAFSVSAILAAVYAGLSPGGMLAICGLSGAAAFSMGSGLVAAVIAAAIVIWKAWLGEVSAVRAGLVGALLLGLAVLAYGIGRTTLVVGAGIYGNALQVLQLALLLLCWLPAWIHGVRYLRGERSPLDLAILCVGLWAFVQIAAMILLRPAFRLWFPISRYMDVIPVGMFAVLASLCRLGSSRQGLPFALDARLPRIALFAATGVAIAASPLAIHWQLRSAGFHREQARVIRRYIQSHDPRVLSDAPQTSLAYPSRVRLQAWLDDPDVDAIIASALDRDR